MEVVKAEAAGRLGLRIYPRAQGRALRVKAEITLQGLTPQPLLSMHTGSDSFSPLNVKLYLSEEEAEIQRGDSPKVT